MYLVSLLVMGLLAPTILSMPHHVKRQVRLETTESSETTGQEIMETTESSETTEQVILDTTESSDSTLETLTEIIIIPDIFINDTSEEDSTAAIIIIPIDIISNETDTTTETHTSTMMPMRKKRSFVEDFFRIPPNIETRQAEETATGKDSAAQSVETDVLRDPETKDPQNSGSEFVETDDSEPAETAGTVETEDPESEETQDSSVVSSETDASANSESANSEESNTEVNESEEGEVTVGSVAISPETDQSESSESEDFQESTTETDSSFPTNESEVESTEDSGVVSSETDESNHSDSDNPQESAADTTEIRTEETEATEQSSPELNPPFTVVDTGATTPLNIEDGNVVLLPIVIELPSQPEDREPLEDISRVGGIENIDTGRSFNPPCYYNPQLTDKVNYDNFQSLEIPANLFVENKLYELFQNLKNIINELKVYENSWPNHEAFYNSDHIDIENFSENENIYQMEKLNNQPSNDNDVINFEAIFGIIQNNPPRELSVTSYEKRK